MNKEVLQDPSVEDVTVFVPVGGLGTRARAVTGDVTPKHLIELGEGRLILDIVCAGLQRVGFRNFVFCTGHHKEQIRDYLTSGSWISAPDVNYDISEEKRPLGPERAVRQAIDTQRLDGQGLVIPGDMILPWRGIAQMSSRHAKRGTDITLAVTSHPEAYPAHFGRLVVEERTDRFLWCHDKPTKPGDSLPGSRNLTSAAALAMDIGRFAMLYDRLEMHAPIPEGSIDLRDSLLSLALGSHEFSIDAYDTLGGVIDIGTVDTIRYAQENLTTLLVH